MDQEQTVLEGVRKVVSIGGHSGDTEQRYNLPSHCGSAIL